MRDAAVPGPTAGLVNSLASWVWLERTTSGPVAFLLLGHAEAQSAEVRSGLVGLSVAFGLAAPGRKLPDVGRRLAVIGGRLAAVRVDGCDYMVQVEVGRKWAEFVAAGGPVALIVGLAPVSPGAPREEVRDYLATNTRRGHLRLGLAESVGSFAESEVGHAPRRVGEPRRWLFQ